MPLFSRESDPFRAVTQTLVASAARTTTGASAELFVGAAQLFVVEVEVTAASGTTPTLVVSLDDTFDGTDYNSVALIPAAGNITTTGRTLRRLNLLDTPSTDRVRVSWTIGGTGPSFTFAVFVYAARF